MRIAQKVAVILIALFIAVPLALPLAEAAGQEIIQTVDQSIDYNFRDHLTFSLEAASEADIVEVELLYRIVGRPATSRNDADFAPGSSVSAQFVIDQTKPENYFPPGTELEYWWKVTDAAGNELKTERERLLYLDNRYDWQTLENDRLTLYWYEGGDSFGQALFDRANVALDTLETDVGIGLEDPIKIFIYGGHQDLLGAISTSSQEWTGGQAFPNYGVVVIGIAPSQLNWGLDATTHEMTHLVIHQATDNPYGDLPRWLDEGIAVYNENQDELDDDFRAVFEQAVERDELMTLRSLSSPFPSDPMEANLAYGQSGATVKFIIDTYGTEAMSHLLDIFSEGAIYDEALQEALGVGTDGLDNAFRASLNLPPLPGVEAEAPAEVVAPEAQPGEAAVEPVAETSSEEAPEAAGAGTESSAPAVEPPAQPVSESSESQSGGGLALPCLAGFLPLLALGWVILRK
jgi:hypothetical protein